MSRQSFKCCLFFERIFEQKGPEPPDEIKQLFDKYSENGTMSTENLLKFTREYQKEKNATNDDAQKIFDSLRHLNIIKQESLNLNAFFLYLLSDLNLPLPPKDHVHHDMAAPLSHYYLYTGHNSYLTGNQFCSRSCTKPIINALQRGVRVIELDLWPKRLKKGVKVCHGDGNTNIRDMLHRHDNSHYLKEFCSPNSLMGKVLISTKPPKKYLETQDTKVKGDLQKLPPSSKIEVPTAENLYSKTDSDITDKDEPDSGELTEEEDEEKLSPKYRDLIAIHAMKFKGGSANALAIDQSDAKRLSMSEQQLEKAVKAHGADIVRFTQRNLLRVYPKGTRIDSSNYNPFFGWEHGAQMVTFNMQGADKYLWIMQGMFRANGGCGYVKKPEFLLKDGPRNNFFRPSQQLKVKKTLKVKIFHGEGSYLDFHLTAFDKYSPPDFFVKIGIAGVTADANQSRETEKAMDQWVPVWNQEFRFSLTVPELAVLCIEVYDYDKGHNDLAGQTCLPVSELRRGIRAVPFHNKKGDQYKHTRLLMRFRYD